MGDWIPLLGVVMAQVVIVALYLARQRAEDQRRWDEKRLDLCARFVGVHSRDWIACMRRERLGLRYEKAELDQLREERASLYGQINLLMSSPEVADAADHWNLILRLREDGIGEPPEFHEVTAGGVIPACAMDDLSAAGQRFHEAVKRELRIR